MSFSVIHDSLPYIDAEPTTAERVAAQALINASLETPLDPASHPFLPPLIPANFSPLIESEHQRIAAKEPLQAIDTSRYESSDLPSPTVPNSKKAKSAEVLKNETAQVLQGAYTTSTYLSARTTNLTLLDTFGKNSWLIGNAQLEDELRAIEQELADAKTEIDYVVVARKGAQEGVAGEIMGLGETWRRGVGRVLETEVAAEGLRREILERRRAGV